MIRYRIRDIKRFLKWNLFNRYRHWYQRATRGFSDWDAFNGDTYIAGQIAGIMEWIVKEGNGVSTTYADDWNTPVELMAERRDADYAIHIAIFKEYSRHGLAYDQEWQREFGGILDEQIQYSLQWFKEHFYDLWD